MPMNPMLEPTSAVSDPVSAVPPRGVRGRPVYAWLVATGLLIFLCYLPDGLVHLKLGQLAYARDVLVGLHFGIALIFLERKRLLFPFLKKLWPISACALALLPLFIARTDLKDFLVHMKWIVLWFDWMLIGFLSWHLRPFGRVMHTLLLCGFLMILADSAIGFRETRTNQFLLAVDRTEETASGSQLGRSQSLQGTVRAQGLQRSVFAFSNMMGLGILMCAALAVCSKRNGSRILFCIFAGWFVYVAFVSGGRSSLLGIAALLACMAWALYARVGFVRSFPTAALMGVLAGTLICLVGLGEVLSFVTVPFYGSSRAFSMVSVWERDAIWAERIQTMNEYPIGWLTGMPSVHTLVQSAAGIDFADNTLLYLIYHFGVPITLLFLGAFYNAVTERHRRAYPAAYAVFALSLAFVWGEGIARDTLWYFGCMPLFLSLGYLTAEICGLQGTDPHPSHSGHSRKPPRPLSLALLSAILLPAFSAAEADSVFPSSAPAGVFVEGNKVELQVSKSPGTDWLLEDVQGREIQRGRMSAGNALDLGTLPTGYYRLEVGDFRTRFAVVFPDIPLQKQFCLDVAGNELVRQSASLNPFQPEDALAVLAELSFRAGVGMVRDRIHWPTVNPLPAKFDWKQYPAGFGAHAGRGIETILVFQTAPAWALAGRMTQPGDLEAVFQFAKEAAAQFKDSVAAWEYWNEPDERLCSDPAWDYAAGLKAACAGFKAGAPGIDVLVGSNAQHPVPKFFEVTMANRAGDFFDVFNFHTYSSPGALIRMTGQKRDFLSHYGHGDKPVWLTEVGWRGQENGRVPGFLPKERRDEHDDGQEMDQARFLVQSLVAGASRGIDRVFYFILTPFNEDEGKRPWGLLRWDWTVKPGYAALATLNAMTSGKRHVGTMAFGSDVAAHVFESPEGDQSLLLWSGEPVDLPIDGVTARTRLVGFLGDVGKISAADGERARVAVSRDPVWVTGMRGLIATKLLPSGAPAPGVLPEKIDRHTVLSIRLDVAFQITNRVAASLPQAGEGTAVLTVWNLSETARDVMLKDGSTGVGVRDLSGSVRVDARSSAEIPLRLRLDAASVSKRELHISGTTDVGMVSPVVVPMRLPEDGLGAGVAHEVSVSNVGRWSKSASSFMKINAAPAGEGVEFVCWFDEGVEKWIYPTLKLEGGKETLAGSLGLQFDVKIQEGESSKAFLMAGAPGSAAFQFDYKPSADWKTVTLIWANDAPAGFDPAACRTIKIGMNPTGKTIRYRVRNLKIYHAKSP